MTWLRRVEQRDWERRNGRGRRALACTAAMPLFPTRQVEGGENRHMKTVAFRLVLMTGARPQSVSVSVSAPRQRLPSSGPTATFVTPASGLATSCFALVRVNPTPLQDSTTLLSGRSPWRLERLPHRYSRTTSRYDGHYDAMRARGFSRRPPPNTNRIGAVDDASRCPTKTEHPQ